MVSRTDWKIISPSCLQDKALSEMDKEDSPAESNESDSEDAAVDREKALKEKDKVKHFWELYKVVKPKKQ